MAKVERGTFTFTSTGNHTLSLNDYTLIPTHIAATVVTNSGAERTVGLSDGVFNTSGSSGTYTDTSLSKLISHNRSLSGIKTKTFEMSCTGFSTGDVHLNVSTRTENTQVSFVIYGN